MIHWLLPVALACAVEPSGWERKTLEGSPVSVLVPAGSEPQKKGQRHPGFDEAAEGWQLQSKRSEEGGTSRMILYLKRGDITVYYGRDASEPKAATLDEVIDGETNGRPPEAEQYGKWKGYTVRLVALKDKDRHPAGDPPFGDLAIHAVEFGPREYLAVVLHAHPDAVRGYLPYFYKVRDSIRYAKAKPVVIAAKPAPARPAPPQAVPQKKKLVLLPHLGRTRLGRNYYPYVRVLQCPAGTLPSPSAWPHAGAVVCRPVQPFSGL